MSFRSWNAVDDAVDDDQRFVRCPDRARAADTDQVVRPARPVVAMMSAPAMRPWGAWSTKTTGTSLMSLILTLAHRPRQVGFLHCAVADHDHFVDGRLRSVRGCTSTFVRARPFRFRLHSRCTGRSSEAPSGTGIRVIALWRWCWRRSSCPSPVRGCRADQRLAALVRNLARYGMFGSAFLREGRRCRQRSRNQQDQ